MAESSTFPDHPSVTFRLGGRIEINRLGYGAKCLAGPGVWGPPDDPSEAFRTLQALPDLGVDFVDTADSYGPAVSERMIREALYPYDGMVISTKAGLRRPGPNQWLPDARPEHLRKRVQQSLEILGIGQIPLWQLHRIDPRVPRSEQFGAIREMRADGLIDLVGLSEVTVQDIVEAAMHFPVATVRNRYNVFDRKSEDVLIYCEENGIGFIPWAPLAGSRVQAAWNSLGDIAKRHRATTRQIALSWLLHRSPVTLPVPRTAKRMHLAENVAALRIRLSDDEMNELGALTDSGMPA
jgi:pyridoxine 4-dehydrogenase